MITGYTASGTYICSEINCPSGTAFAGFDGSGGQICNAIPTGTGCVGPPSSSGTFYHAFLTGANILTTWGACHSGAVTSEYSSLNPCGSLGDSCSGPCIWNEPTGNTAPVSSFGDPDACGLGHGSTLATEHTWRTYDCNPSHCTP